MFKPVEELEIAALKPQLHLSAEEIGRIVTFLGYGPTSAPVWFVGFEEGLGDMTSADTVRNLKARGVLKRRWICAMLTCNCMKTVNRSIWRSRLRIPRSGNIWRKSCWPITEIREVSGPDTYPPRISCNWYAVPLSPYIIISRGNPQVSSVSRLEGSTVAQTCCYQFS
jgi:hypothetical protein